MCYSPNLWICLKRATLFQLEKDLRLLLDINQNITKVFIIVLVCSKQHNFTEALKWLTRSYNVCNTNVLHLITDPDLEDVLQDQESFLEIKNLIRKMYTKCIRDNFQGRFKCMIDLTAYNQRYKGNFTNADIDLLNKYNINHKNSWNLCQHS